MLKGPNTTAIVFKRLGFISQILIPITAVLLLQVAPGHCTIIEDATIEKEILEKYPGLFYTEEEIRDAISKLKKPQTDPLERDIIPMTDIVTYNGCCKSNSTMKSFSELPDIDGRYVTLVQFHGKKQWVQQDTCRTAINCDKGCSCSMERRYFSALIKNPDFPHNSIYRHILDLVYAPLVCKCFNNLYRPCDEDISPGAMKDICLAP